MSMQEELEQIEAKVSQDLMQAETMDALEQLRVKVLGKKGSLTTIMRMMGKIPPEMRPTMGKLANTVRANVDEALKQRRLELTKEELESDARTPEEQDEEAKKERQKA